MFADKPAYADSAAHVPNGNDRRISGQGVAKK